MAAASGRCTAGCACRGRAPPCSRPAALRLLPPAPLAQAAGPCPCRPPRTPQSEALDHLQSRGYEVVERGYALLGYAAAGPTAHAAPAGRGSLALPGQAAWVHCESHRAMMRLARAAVL